MFSNLKILLQAPTYVDPEKTRLAKLLNKILLAINIILFLYLFIIPFHPEPLKELAFIFIAIIFTIGLLIITRYGHITLACWCLSIIAYFALSLSVIVFGGVRSSSYSSLIIVIIITSILLGAKAAVFMSILSIFSGWLYLIAETQGFLMPQEFYLSPNNLWFSQSVSLILATVLLVLASDNLTQALNNARESEKALAQSNEGLLANMRVLEEQETILRQVLADLTASNENYQAVFNATSEAIFIQDADTGQILDVNQAMLDMYGYQYKEALQITIEDLSSGIQPYTGANAAQYIDKANNDGVQLFEWMARRKNGELFWVEVALRKSMIGHTPRILAVVRDISIRKKQEADREALIEQLEQKNDDLERFTYTISHDLKSPLITINGFLGYLEQDISTEQVDSAISDIEQIRQATNRMQKLLDELLELSRVGRVSNEIETIPFNELLEEAMQAVSGQAIIKNIEVVITPDMPAVTGDRSQLVAIAQNLLGNAIKFTGLQSKPRIEIGYLADESTPIYFIKDNGLGIEPKNQEKIFDIFERLDPTVDGTGLGLALVKRMVEVHNGRLWLESEGVGKGSTFFFTIPDPVPNESSDSPN